MTVSYTPFLTKVVDCHLDVNIMFTVNSFVYLYIYQFTGPDNTRYTITNENRQHSATLKDFVDASFVSPSKAPWRMFSFAISGNLGSVVCLTVHLPGLNLH